MINMKSKDLKLMLDSFPAELHDDINYILMNITLKTSLYYGGFFSVNIGEEIVSIPERIYYEDIEEYELSKLNETQRKIVDCFFTRHHNGYTRQKKLNNIFMTGIVDKWTLPYLIKLSGEYVIEIVEDIFNNFSLVNMIQLREFINDNKKFINTTESRIASYWGEYYRRDFKRDEYVGFKLKNLYKM